MIFAAEGKQNVFRGIKSFTHPPTQDTTPACRNAALRRAGTGLPVEECEKRLSILLRRDVRPFLEGADELLRSFHAKALKRRRIMGTTALAVGLHFLF